MCIPVSINSPKSVTSAFLLLVEVFLDMFLNCVLDAYHARGVVFCAFNDFQYFLFQEKGLKQSEIYLDCPFRNLSY